MKQQIRMVRIFFLAVAAVAVGAFYAGFYFGDGQSGNAYTTGENLAEGASAGTSENSGETVSSGDGDALESMTTLLPDKYYLKQNGDCLSVYKGTSSAVYFDTDLRVDALPETLQELSAEGIAFDDLASVYEFLENYSS